MVANYFINFTDPEVPPFNINAFTSNGPATPTSLVLNSTAVTARTSLLLYGKGHPEYGERIQEHLINIMENFSGASEPTNPISGQTWFSRITYVRTGGSPALFYRWQDDANDPNEGSWIALTPVASNPTNADEVITSATQPTGTITNGAFWYQPPVGSPLPTQGTLHIGVNTTTSNISPASEWRPREFEDFSLNAVPEIVGAPNPAEYQPQKQLKVFDGVKWKNTGNVFSGEFAPQRPVNGDMWFRTSGSPASVVGSPEIPLPNGNQLFIWQHGEWLPTGYVDTGGDTMVGTLQFGVPGSLFLWEGDGDHLTGPDIRTTGEMLQTTETDFYIHIDDNDTSVGAFEVAKGTRRRGGSPLPTSLFQVLNDGTIRSALPGSPTPYTALVTAGDSNTLVHKAYVDGTVSLATTNAAHIALLSGGSPIVAKVNRSGDTMTGRLTFSTGGSPSFVIDTGGNDITLANSGQIKNLADPTDPFDAVTLNWINNNLGSPLGSGGGGPAIIGGSPFALPQFEFAVLGSPAKTYALTTIGASPGGSPIVPNSTGVLVFVNGVLQQEGDTGSPQLANFTFDYNTQTITFNDGAVPNPGDSIAVYAVGGLSNGTGVTTFAGRSGVVVPQANDYDTSQIINLSSVSGGFLTNALNNLVQQAGDTMDGTLTFNVGSPVTGSPRLVSVDAGGAFITNVQTPTEDDDAANKSYVDNAFSRTVTAFQGGVAQSIPGTTSTLVTNMVLDFEQGGNYRLEAYIPVRFNSAPSGSPNGFLVDLAQGSPTVGAATPTGNITHTLYEVGNANTIRDAKNDTGLVTPVTMDPQVFNTNQHVIKVEGTLDMGTLGKISSLRLQMARTGSAGGVLVGGDAHMIATKID